MPDENFYDSAVEIENRPARPVSNVTNRNFEGNNHTMDQEVVNIIFKTLDDMFLRLFCIGTEKSEIERLKKSGITSIVEIKKNLDILGLKFRDGI